MFILSNYFNNAKSIWQQVKLKRYPLTVGVPFFPVVFRNDWPIRRRLIAREPIEIVDLVPVVDVAREARFFKVRVGIFVSEVVGSKTNSVAIFDDSLRGDVKVEIGVVSFMGSELLTGNHKSALKKINYKPY